MKMKKNIKVHFDIVLNILVVFVSIGCIIEGLNLAITEVFFLFFFLFLFLFLVFSRQVVAICGVNPFDFFSFLVQIVSVGNYLLCMSVETLRTVIIREVDQRYFFIQLIVVVLI
jgi:hypothetical protein